MVRIEFLGTGDDGRQKAKALTGDTRGLLFQGDWFQVPKVITASQFRDEMKVRFGDRPVPKLVRQTVTIRGIVGPPEKKFLPVQVRSIATGELIRTIPPPLAPPPMIGIPEPEEERILREEKSLRAIVFRVAEKASDILKKIEDPLLSGVEKLTSFEPARTTIGLNVIKLEDGRIVSAERRVTVPTISGLVQDLATGIITFPRAIAELGVLATVISVNPKRGIDALRQIKNAAIQDPFGFVSQLLSAELAISSISRLLKVARNRVVIDSVEPTTFKFLGDNNFETVAGYRIRVGDKRGFITILQEGKIGDLGAGKSIISVEDGAGFISVEGSRLKTFNIKGNAFVIDDQGRIVITTERGAVSILQKGPEITLPEGERITPFAGAEVEIIDSRALIFDDFVFPEGTIRVRRELGSITFKGKVKSRVTGELIEFEKPVTLSDIIQFKARTNSEKGLVNRLRDSFERGELPPLTASEAGTLAKLEKRLADEVGVIPHTLSSEEVAMQAARSLTEAKEGLGVVGVAPVVGVPSEVVAEEAVSPLERIGEAIERTMRTIESIDLGEEVDIIPRERVEEVTLKSLEEEIEEEVLQFEIPAVDISDIVGEDVALAVIPDIAVALIPDIIDIVGDITSPIQDIDIPRPTPTPSVPFEPVALIGITPLDIAFDFSFRPFELLPEPERIKIERERLEEEERVFGFQPGFFEIQTELFGPTPQQYLFSLQEIRPIPEERRPRKRARMREPSLAEDISQSFAGIFGGGSAVDNAFDIGLFPAQKKGRQGIPKQSKKTPRRRARRDPLEEAFSL